MRRYNTTASCNTAGTGTLRYCGLTRVDQSEPVAHPYSLDNIERKCVKRLEKQTEKEKYYNDAEKAYKFARLLVKQGEGSCKQRKLKFVSEGCYELEGETHCNERLSTSSEQPENCDQVIKQTQVRRRALLTGAGIYYCYYYYY